MPQKRLTAIEIIDLIPDQLFEKLGSIHKVDYQLKKLYGKRIFQLLLYGLLTQKALSFRILETLFEKPVFRQYASIPEGLSTDHSSLAERLSFINVEYFEELFEEISKILSLCFPAKKLESYKIIRFDSTLISLSSSLLKCAGFKNGRPSGRADKAPKLEVKFSIGFDGQNMRKAMFFNQPNAINEHVTLQKAIQASDLQLDEVEVFDRGISKRKSFESFNANQIQFVTRLKSSKKREVKYKEVSTYTEISPNQTIETETLFIEKDIEVCLYDKYNRKTKDTFRFIKATIKLTKEPIIFLTNITTLSPEAITEIYKRRWDIEVLFRFLKQEMNMKHFLSRNENGIKVVMYMTLIASMLIYIYRAINNLKSFRIAKLKFINDLELEILKIIIELSQGNPDFLKKFNSS